MPAYAAEGGTTISRCEPAARSGSAEVEEPALRDFARLAAAAAGAPVARVVACGRSAVHGAVNASRRAERAFPELDPLPANVVVIPDLTDRPDLIGPASQDRLRPYRFLAAVPVTCGDAAPCGAVYVLDLQPRELSALQADSLAAVARQLGRLVEMSRQRMSDRLAREHTRLLAEGARCILWNAEVRMYGSVADWEFRIANEGAAREFLPVECFQNQTYAEAWKRSHHPDDQKRMDETFMAAILSGAEGYAQEFRCRKVDGEERWLREDVRIESTGCDQYRLVGVCVDITDRKRAELALSNERDALRETEERSRALLAAIPQRVFFKDRDSRFISVNASLAQDLGTTPEGAIGRTDLDFFPPDLAAKYRADDEAVLASREPLYVEERNVVGGVERIVAVTKSPVLDSEGHVIGLLGLFDDITEKHSAQKALRVSEERFQAFMDNSPAVAWIKDSEGRYVYVNRPYERLFGVRLEDRQGATDSEAWPHELASTWRKTDQEVLRSNAPFEYNATLTLADGTDHHLFILKFPLSGPDGVRYVGGMAVDVSERVRAEAALRTSEQELRAIFHEAAVGMVRIDLEAKVLEVNAAHSELVGYDADALSTMTFWDFTHPDDRAAESSLFDELAAGKRSHYHIEKRLVRSSGKTIWVHTTVSLVRNAEGQPSFAIRMVEDISDRKWFEDQIRQQMDQINEQIIQINRYSAELEQQKSELQAANSKLEGLATTDGLTGLKNHRALHERLNEEFHRARRYNTPLSIIELDVDEFKKYNDSFGHKAGDNVLVTIAKLLLQHVREHDLVARNGGEEFVLILPGTDHEGSMQVAERLRRSIEAFCFEHRRVTASFGVCTMQPTTLSGSAILEEADCALYRSKRSGRNRVTHATDMEMTAA